MKFYKHTSIMKINNINCFNFKFEFQIFKYKLKNELMILFNDTQNQSC
jgi:hypothetical protein